MIAFLASWPGRLAVLGLAVVIAAGAGYFKGGRDERAEMLRDTVKALQNRSAIDADVQGLSAFDLCVGIGGLPNECEELRRLDETAETE